jgi:ketosteroid isomerase-like protein
MSNSQNIQTILQVLQDEIDGDVRAALEKITDDYSMTWVYRKNEDLRFPSTTRDLEAELRDVYHIKGREYDIRNITEGEDVVMIEMIESYPDPDTGRVYRTPQVLVLEMERGKIKKGRHYCDPRLSYEELSLEEIEAEALKGTPSKRLLR